MENRIDELKAALWSSDPWVADNHSFFCLHCGMKYNGDVPQGTHHANCIWLVNFQEVESGLTPLALDFCPTCDNTGYRRVSPTILAKCSCKHGQSQ
jgi:hypothetical protein